MSVYFIPRVIYTMENGGAKPDGELAMGSGGEVTVTASTGKEHSMSLFKV